MRVKWKLTIASLKMFFREREAVFWTLFLPLFMVVLFGFVKFDQLGKVQIGVVNEDGAGAAAVLSRLRQVQTVTLLQGSRDAELRALGKGDRDLVLLIPKSFSAGTSRQIETFLNDAKPQEAQLATLIVQQTIDEMSIGSETARTSRTKVIPRQMKSRKLTYMDFLIPGILAMSIMQMGVFSVAFVFVDLKKRGILRRLKVTPVNPNDFILAQVVTRLIVLLMQVLVLVAAGVFFFKFNFIGSLWNMFAFGILGSVVFLAMGFAIAGVSRSEDQVAPLANVVTMPMLLLSGVFFSRANLPGFAHVLTDYFPLTYLADGLRSIAIDGASLLMVTPQLVGLTVWAVISCLLAVKLFRWE
jgi:ABC-2 type transport system permease protein